jgi:hypothetical protein
MLLSGAYARKYIRILAVIEKNECFMLKHIIHFSGGYKFANKSSEEEESFSTEEGEADGKEECPEQNAAYKD